MNKHKVGQTKPDISKVQALSLHNLKCTCSKPYIISKPIGIIEEIKIFGIRFYSEKCWHCLNCNWESEKIRTRTL
jgi:hypothetical protein